MTRKRKPSSQPSVSDDTLDPKRSRPTERRAGTIERMILKNFMCHSLLDVDLSTNINILIGRNGSGKSAILTALIVGLGGKASLTNRGTSIKSFIKAGRNSGSVEIQLYNGGPLAYRPKLYGKKIVIIRNMSASGSSSYRVKSESGEVITTQAREIANITTFLNIQVDNPICILNQDTSRNFLSSNDPKHKFTLFMKATQLETLKNEYKATKSNKLDSVRIFGEKETNLTRFQQELKVLKRKVENHKSIANIREKLTAVQLELLWAKVRDSEEALRKEESNVGSLQRKHDNFLSDCATRSERIKYIKNNIEGLKQQVSELKDALKVQLRPMEDVRVIMEDLRGKYVLKKQAKQLITNSIESKKRDLAILEDEIANVNENLSRAEEEKMKRLRDLNTMTEKIKNMEEHLQTIRNDLYQMKYDTNLKDEEKQRLKQEILQIDHKISNERSSLNALKNESDNTLLLYGRDMPKVIKMIEQHKNRFTHVPKGPLGSYIKLKEKKWAVAAESHLGPALLGAFTVDNKNDNLLLSEILSRTWSSDRKPMIITSKFFFQKHNVRANLVRAPSDCVCLYDVLEIEDPVVSNCVVDQSRIEGILLIPNNDRAMQLLSDAAHVPKNCEQGITVGADTYYPDPNYKSYGSRYHRARYLQVDTKEHILQLEDNITTLLEKKEGLQNQYSSICKEINEQEAKKNQLEERIRKLTGARSQIRNQLEELKSTAEPEVASVELLENELVQVKNYIKEKEVELNRVGEDIKEIKTAVRENEEKIKQFQEANSGLEERIRAIEGQINEETIRQKEISTSDAFDKRRIEDMKARLSEAKSTLIAQQSSVERYTDQATSFGARVETSRDVKDIVAEISSLEVSVKKIQNNTEDTEELQKKYDMMTEKYHVTLEIFEGLRNDIKELTEALENRAQLYVLTENYFITFMKNAFKRFMEVRQFQGSIEINMNDKKLELIVIPQHGSQGLTNITNLSGGERSFSTVGFLYSLWQCMEFPFYFLDEFDVYMDKLNRSKVIEILIHHAKCHPELQFVFLTPQDVSFVNKDVSILRLADPERMPV